MYSICLHVYEQYICTYMDWVATLTKRLWQCDEVDRQRCDGKLRVVIVAVEDEEDVEVVDDWNWAAEKQDDVYSYTCTVHASIHVCVRVYLPKLDGNACNKFSFLAAKLSTVHFPVEGRRLYDLRGIVCVWDVERDGVARFVGASKLKLHLNRSYGGGIREHDCDDGVDDRVWEQVRQWSCFEETRRVRELRHHVLRVRVHVDSIVCKARDLITLYFARHKNIVTSLPEHVSISTRKHCSVLRHLFQAPHFT